jgi:peptidoglycan/LPS O-acetylase OafA/YrhL
MMPWALAFSLTIIVTTIFAAVSWHLIEKPALSFKPRTLPTAG